MLGDCQATLMFLKIMDLNKIHLVSCLSMLDENMLKEIVPKIGDRAKLKSNINDWRKILDMTNDKVNFLNISNDYPQDLNISITPPLTIPEFEENILTTNTDNESVVLDSETSTHSSIDSKTDEGLPLLDYLKKNSEGRAILASNKTTLDNAARRKLCSIIVRMELQDDPEKQFKTPRLLSLSQEIVKIFPGEHISTYFIPYINYGPMLKKSAKGILLDCFNNRRREYKKVGLIANSPKHTDHSLPKSALLLASTQPVVYTDSENVDESLSWLHNSSDPWDLVVKHWSITRATRLKKFWTQILKRYP
ncbi:uncharacterized protein LOC132933014 [Metopolophium dirhodum]|uniref:uncharacterized protein LOC132933014 n=1 Tax=Metopolophium dirhodum TaxID=44670 RepID=UPI0029907E7F|nr:uncharacterized protein LOC132933014 [Metopolophium dirhodum]